jgi:hypothetical protein
MTTAGEAAWDGMRTMLIALATSLVVLLGAVVFYLGFRAGYAAGRSEPAAVSPKGAP